MTVNDVHAHWMRRCLELATYGLGNVAPNPLVGCVIVKDGKCIAEGSHRYHGAPHAEPDAIGRIHDETLLQGATLYVNLEPCAHHGKTPPCAPLIVQKGIKQVVIANVDPFEHVNGAGIRLMQQHGIEVITDVLKQEGEWLNRRFFTFHQEKRPWIILKWAQSMDGFIAPASQNEGEITWITGIESQTLVHQWRAEEQAILIGTNTVIKDDPSLTVRHVHGSNPLRIVFDLNNRIPTNTKVLTDGFKTIIFNQEHEKIVGVIQWLKTTPAFILTDLMQFLYREQIQSLIVEGGTTTINHFIEQNMWDETRYFVGNSMLEHGIKAPEINQIINQEQFIGSDKLYKIIRNE